jgi:hypothetical protein
MVSRSCYRVDCVMTCCWACSVRMRCSLYGLNAYGQCFGLKRGAGQTVCECCQPNGSAGLVRPCVDRCSALLVTSVCVVNLLADLQTLQQCSAVFLDAWSTNWPYQHTACTTACSCACAAAVCCTQPQQQECPTSGLSAPRLAKAATAQLNRGRYQ